MMENKLPVLADVVFNDLLKKIIEVEFFPGEKISENDISRRYNVSRSVIRSAFGRLREMKFIDVFPQRGSFVSLIDIKYIENILILRASIEKEMLLRLMDLPSEKKNEVKKLLQDNLSKQKDYYNKKYTEEFKFLDEEFHRIIIESAHGEGVISLISSHLNHMIRWRNLDIVSLNRINQLIDDHSKIVDAIIREDKNELNISISNHLLSIYDVSRIMKEKAPQYFNE